MKPKEFLESIYLGDRACKGILIDSWRKEVKIHIDSISRVRGEIWDFYTAEDVDDGFLVFEGVDQFSFDPPGRFPDDEMGDIEFVGYESDRFTVNIDIGSVEQTDGKVKFHNVKLKIRAKAVAIEKPGEEDARVRE